MGDYEITEANIDDIDALVSVHESSMQSDWIYCRIIRDVDPKEAREFARSMVRQKFDHSYCKVFKVTDLRTRSIVAWAGLEYPHDPDDHDHQTSGVVGGPPAGTQRELLQIFTGPLSRGVSSACGFNPEIHFHHAGTRVAQEHQRKGIATLLSHHLSKIASRSGRRLFICVRPAAVRLCEKNGYQEVGRYDVDLSHFGGEGIDTSVVFVKIPENH